MAAIDLSRRSEQPELMDDPNADWQELAGALAGLRAVNRYLGGRRALASGLARLVESCRARRLTLLDVGAGSADLPLEALEFLRKRGFEARAVCLDLSEKILRDAAGAISGKRDLLLVRGDGLALPFKEASFDIVTASLFLHHLKSDMVPMALAEMWRVARRGLIVNDLRRSIAAYYATKIFLSIVTDNRMLLNDGPLSVARGFTEGELLSAVAAAELENARVERRLPFRLLLTALKRS